MLSEKNNLRHPFFSHAHRVKCRLLDSSSQSFESILIDCFQVAESYRRLFDDVFSFLYEYSGFLDSGLGRRDVGSSWRQEIKGGSKKTFQGRVAKCVAVTIRDCLLRYNAYLAFLSSSSAIVSPSCPYKSKETELDGSKTNMSILGLLLSIQELAPQIGTLRIIFDMLEMKTVKGSKMEHVDDQKNETRKEHDVKDIEEAEKEDSAVVSDDIELEKNTEIENGVRILSKLKELRDSRDSSEQLCSLLHHLYRSAFSSCSDSIRFALLSPYQSSSAPHFDSPTLSSSQQQHSAIDQIMKLYKHQRHLSFLLSQRNVLPSVSEIWMEDYHYEEKNQRNEHSENEENESVEKGEKPEKERGVERIEVAHIPPRENEESFLQHEHEHGNGVEENDKYSDEESVENCANDGDEGEYSEEEEEENEISFHFPSRHSTIDKENQEIVSLRPLFAEKNSHFPTLFSSSQQSYSSPSFFGENDPVSFFRWSYLNPFSSLLPSHVSPSSSLFFLSFDVEEQKLMYKMEKTNRLMKEQIRKYINSSQFWAFFRELGKKLAQTASLFSFEALQVLRARQNEEKTSVRLAVSLYILLKSIHTSFPLTFQHFLSGLNQHLSSSTTSSQLSRFYLLISKGADPFPSSCSRSVSYPSNSHCLSTLMEHILLQLELCKNQSTLSSHELLQTYPEPAEFRKRKNRISFHSFFDSSGLTIQLQVSLFFSFVFFSYFGHKSAVRDSTKIIPSKFRTGT